MAEKKQFTKRVMPPVLVKREDSFAKMEEYNQYGSNTSPGLQRKEKCLFVRGFNQN
jgi:hypothetical protein